MNRQDEADYTALKEYLCDMILEEQLKLGYERETIRFYSPSSSIDPIYHPSPSLTIVIPGLLTTL